MYDLLIKGGTVVDPSQGIHGVNDVAIEDGKVKTETYVVHPRTHGKPISMLDGYEVELPSRVSMLDV